MKKIPIVSMKNTKAELLRAYEEMKADFQKEQKEWLSPVQRAAAKEEEKRILQKTSTYIPEDLENDIVSLNKKIRANLEEVKNKLVQESKKLSELRKAVKIKAKHLEQVYHIKLAADTLGMLISDYDEKQGALEKQKAAVELAFREETENRKKEREREEEEYNYSLKIARKKEHDQYEIEQLRKRAEHQAEINKRMAEFKKQEDILREKEQETENLRKQAEEFPKKTELTVEGAKKETTEILRKEFAVQKQISEERWLSEKKMFEVKINNLQENINNQSAEIASLKNLLSEANQRAQELATTIIENVSKSKQLKLVESVQKETDKGR